MSPAYVVGASEFGGPGDSSTSGDGGACIPHQTGRMSYAELYMGNALGHLPCRTQLRISYKGKAVVAEKGDIGLGGNPVKGHSRRIDLWYQTAQALGFSGTDLVTIERVDGKPISGPADVQSKTQLPGVNELENKIRNDPRLNAKEKAEALESLHLAKAGAKEGSQIQSAAEEALSWSKKLGEILGFLGTSDSWLRIGKVLLGSILLIVAIDELSKISPGPSTNARGGAGKVGKAVKGVAKHNPLEVMESAKPSVKEPWDLPSYE